MKVRKKIRIAISVCIICICALFLVKHYDSKEYTINNKQEYINKVCEMSGVPAMSIAVWDGDTEMYLNYSKNGELVNEHTLYELASTTKAFTALGILQLKEQGMLDYSDPVQQYIPEFHPTYKGNEVNITIEQLLNHTSGIPSYALNLIPEEPYNPGGLSQSLSKLYNIKLIFTPGSRFDYSTVNYDFLALIIENVTGLEFEKYIELHILDELEMTNSFFRRDYIQKNVTQGYKPAFLCTIPFNAPVYYGNTAAGYLISNTNDLMKWMKNVKMLFDFSSFPIDSDNIYFAGWGVLDDFVCHSGENPNYSSYVIIDKNEDIGVFALSSKTGVNAPVVADGLYRILKGESIKIDFHGLYFDYLEYQDLLFIIAPLLLVYIILWIPVDSKKRAIIRIMISVIIICGLSLYPIISHNSYRFTFIWKPGSFAFLIGFSLLCAFYLMMKSIIYIKKHQMKK